MCGSSLYHSGDDGGIEMQEFGNSTTADPMSRASIENNNNINNMNNNNNNSNDLSQANSAISIDYPEHITSTIGKTVDNFHIFSFFLQFEDFV